MKKIIFLAVVLFLAVMHCHAQTVLPSTTTASALGKMKNGVYRIITATDTLDFTKDTALVVTRTIHDTIPRVARSIVGLSYNPKTNQWIATYSDSSTSIFVPVKTLFIQ